MHSAIKRFRWGLKEKRAFAKELDSLKVKCLFSNSSKTPGKGPAFSIVHWNAPDFLLLNIKQLLLIYPNNRIYVLDNGSQKSCLEDLVSSLSQLKNVTLLSAHPEGESAHTIGLQVLTNYSAVQQDDFCVFLDQDCILSRNIDEILLEFGFNKELLIIGARDHVIVPNQHRKLLPYGFLRSAFKLIHPSLMILQPKKIVERFGRVAFSPDPRAWEEARTNKWSYEPYHSISYRARGNILYLETRMHDEIPLLTSYSYKNKIYAYHAWYSSRTTHLHVNDSLDGLSISLLHDIRKKAFAYMSQVHESTFSAANVEC